LSTLYHAFKSGVVDDNPLLIGATTLTSTGLSGLPVVTAPDVLWLALDPEGVAGTPEIVQVTAHTSAATTATIVRGQQTAAGGGAARQHLQNTVWSHVVTPTDITTPIADIAALDTRLDTAEVDIDALQAFDATFSGVWTDWTPTLDQGVTTNIAKTVTYARRVKVGRLVTVAFRLDVTGTGTASSTVLMTLPVTQVSSGPLPCGEGYIFDASANIFYPAQVGVFSATRVSFNSTTVNIASPGLGGATSPFTAALASGDVIAGTFTYESTS
jgi:hypothetical protein